MFIDDLKTNWKHGLLIVAILWTYRVGHLVRAKLIRYPIAKRIALLPIYLPHKILSHSFGCFLPFASTLGRRVEFRHGLYGVFISTGAVIGDDCTIYHNVTVGSTNHGAPIIGANVMLGACCVVVGRLNVGDFAKVGANETVRENVPAHSIVIDCRICQGHDS